MAKKKEIEIELEFESVAPLKKMKKEKKLHEKYEGKETESFKDAQYYLAMAKKHHKQALHHNKIAEEMEKKHSKEKKKGK